MERVADGVRMLSEYPRHAINAYLLDGDDGPVLVDAGTRLWGRRLLRRVASATATDDADGGDAGDAGGLAAHVLTHAHPDHQGSSTRVCERFDAPLWCGADDRAAVETGDLPPHDKGALAGLTQRAMAGPPCDVDGTLDDGDDVADFTVVETPGHTPGHLALWRERDGVLIAGDAMMHMDVVTTRVGLREPMRGFTSDVERARESIRTVVDLEPDLVCFGHGPVLEDDGELEDFVAKLDDGVEGE